MQRYVGGFILHSGFQPKWCRETVPGELSVIVLYVDLFKLFRVKKIDKADKGYLPLGKKGWETLL